MGSVRNCRKEIANRCPIRWFKCKLKPPKNDTENPTDMLPLHDNPLNNKSKTGFIQFKMNQIFLWENEVKLERIVQNSNIFL